MKKWLLYILILGLGGLLYSGTIVDPVGDKSTGESFTATEFNDLKNTLINVINGNLNNANLLNGGVATEDLADDIITPAKIDEDNTALFQIKYISSTFINVTSSMVVDGNSVFNSSITVSSSAIITGNLAVNGTLTVKDIWQRIYSYTVPVASAVSVNITGLSGNTDAQYILYVNAVSTGSAISAVILTFNSDTGNNYHYQELYGGGATAASQEGMTQPLIYLCTTRSVGYRCGGAYNIWASTGPKTGGQRRMLTGTAFCEDSDGTIYLTSTITGFYNDKTTEITSMQISVASGYGLGWGSTIELWVRR
jgi:hypothetical protein